MKQLRFPSKKLMQAHWIDGLIDKCDNENEFLYRALEKLEPLDIELYDELGLILNKIGFKAIVTREGDVNCRFDATIIDSENSVSIPIEIKSPKEDRFINIKSIRQALENKIVLLSRKFYPTEYNITSLAIALEYPPVRSDVMELIENIKKAWNMNIGIISIGDLLRLVYAVNRQNKEINFDYFNHLLGKLEYEKAIRQ